VRSKGDLLKDRTKEQNDGFGFGIGGIAEGIDVAIGAQAADDRGAGWSLNGLALGADGDFAVVADPDAGLLAPDKGPPGTRRDRTQDGAFIGEGFGTGGVRGVPSSRWISCWLAWVRRESSRRLAPTSSRI
jgi:hypothetical protein